MLAATQELCFPKALRSKRHTGTGQTPTTEPTLKHWQLLHNVRQGAPALKDVSVIPQHHLQQSRGQLIQSPARACPMRFRSPCASKPIHLHLLRPHQNSQRFSILTSVPYCHKCSP